MPPALQRSGRRPRFRALAAVGALLIAALIVSWLMVERPPAPRRAGSAPGGAADTGRAEREDRLSQARALLEAGDYPAASSALDRALEASPEDPEALALQVRALSAQRRYTAAADAAARVLAAAPASPLGHVLMGAIALQRGDPVSARRSLESALALDAEAVPALSRLAELDLLEGRVDQARRDARHALAIEPHNAPSLRVLTRLSRSVAELVPLYQRLVEIDPEDTLALGRLNTLRAARATLVDRVVLPSGGVALPLEMEPDGRLAVRLDLGPGAEGLKFLLDTGASGLVLSESIARAQGLSLSETSRSTGLGGISRHVHPILVPRVVAPDLVLADVMAIASEPPPGFAGILNPLLLCPAGSGMALRIRTHPPRLTVGPAFPSGGTGHVTLPYLSDGLHPLVPIVLGDRPSMALLDTGSAADLLDRSLLGRVPATISGPVPAGGPTLVGFGGVIEDADLAGSAALRIAGVDLRRSHVLVLDLNREPFRFQVDIDAIIGIDTLSRFEITIDPGAGSISFLSLDDATGTP